jgi:hypothetical protein
MPANLHAVAVLGTLIVPLIVIAFSHGWHPRPIRQFLGFVVAFAVMGGLCLLLLMLGVPIAEWLFPLIGIVLAGFFVKSQRAFQALCWGLLLMSVGLCGNALALRGHGYTSTPPSLYQSLDLAYLENLGKKLREAYSADHVLAPSLLKEILPELRNAGWNRKTARPLWHTPFTRLYEITTMPGEIWYPGGPVSVGSENLKWKPNAPPNNVKTRHGLPQAP